MKQQRSVIGSGLRSLLVGATLAPMAWAGIALFVAGCSSSSTPQSLSGTQQMDWYERQKYVDQKGHFHPEWVHDNTENTGT